MTHTEGTTRAVTLIGLGSIGSGMAGRLAAAGDVRLTVYNRSPRRYAAVEDLDLTIAATVTEAVEGADVVLLSLTEDAVVREIVDAVAGHLRPGSTIVDTSTISATTARELAEALAARGVGFVDSPVTGGAEAAQRGTLTLLCGSDEATMTAVRPVLQHVSTNVVHVGEHGAGQVAKAVNQVMLAGCLLGVAEGVALARASGLDAGRLMASLRDGAASSWVLRDRAQYMVDGDFAPRGRIALHLKDLRIALDLAAAVGQPLALTELVAGVEQRVVDRGFGDGDVTAIIQGVDGPGGARGVSA